jgi:AcrR family transcriptional regulator
MTAATADGKARRPYDATRRQLRARQQKHATLDAAQALFLERGYVATTVDAIATAAGVSGATVYKSYGGKAGLVRELCARALAGTEPVHAEERSDALRARGDPAAMVEGWGALVTEVSPRISPLLLLLRAAAESDRDAAALHAELDAARLDRMTENARFLVEGGHLRPDVTADEARDVLWLCSSPELYEQMVLRRGWSAARFGTFVADLMTGTLLGAR